MRAKMGLAQCLQDMERTDEAIGHFQDLLRLNPHDNQGVRDILLPLLLVAGQDGAAGALLLQYADDASATWKYGWALWAFRQEGDSPAAQERLRAAVKANRHVLAYLSGKAPIPDMLPDSYAFGSNEEAMLCADGLFEAWRLTPGADRWLLAFAPKRKPAAAKRRRR
jgi:tetratricopeptide (TPR) repeat protein